MPIYKLITKIAPEKSTPVEVTQLVEAANQSAAIRHVASGIITAEVCTTQEAIKLGASGVKLEQAA